MKKLLIASTALVMVAGAAAAEVKLSGDARMGVVYNGEDWNFSNRARVIFTLSGTTDTGLEFGGTFKAHESVDAENGKEGTVFISGAFGKIEMGNTVSAPEALFGDLYEVGYTDLSSNGIDNATDSSEGWRELNKQGLLANDIPYLTGDDNSQSAVLYTYSAGAFSVAASMTDGKDASYDYQGVATDDASEAQSAAVAAAYTFGNYTVGLGYEQLNSKENGVADGDQIELAAVAKFGTTNVKAYYATGEQDDQSGTTKTLDVDAYGVSVDTNFGATTVGAYVQTLKLDGTDAQVATVKAAMGDDSVTWYGVGAAYDLGGGASIVGGIADNNLKGSDAVADLGVKFKF